MPVDGAAQGRSVLLLTGEQFGVPRAVGGEALVRYPESEVSCLPVMLKCQKVFDMLSYCLLLM